MEIVNLFLAVLELKEYLKKLKKIFPSQKNWNFFKWLLWIKNDSSQKLEKIINNEVQILVGTQLISKGFQFSKP